MDRKTTRTMLFADFGRGPRVIAVADAARDFVRKWHAMGNGPTYPTRPWWLVGCESAADGRRVIAAALEDMSLGRIVSPRPDRKYLDEHACLLGRILDSGTPEVAP